MGKYKGVTCFLLTPIARVRLRLRRYGFPAGQPCAGKNNREYHDAEAVIGDEDQPLDHERIHGNLHDTSVSNIPPLIRWNSMTLSAFSGPYSPLIPLLISQLMTHASL